MVDDGPRGGYVPYLIAGGLLIGAALFLGGYASIENSWVSIFTALFLICGALFSEAAFSDRPLFYVAASILLAITVGGCLLSFHPLVIPAAACSLAGPLLVAKGLRTWRLEHIRP